MSKLNMRAIHKQALNEYTEILKVISSVSRYSSTGFLGALEEKAKECLLDFISPFKS